MPRPPLYKEHQMPTSPGTGHRGLWFDRFFNQYDENWAIIKANPPKVEEGKKHWINTVVGLCGDNEQLRAACRRQEELCHQLTGQVLEVKTTWHFTTGLGNPHPVENGFAWHPTLGVPYLTGAAVKGLLRAWVESWMDCEGGDEAAQRHTRLNTLYRWFGSEDLNPTRRKELRLEGFIPPSKASAPDTEAGMFIIFDAIPPAPVKLACDVMTPHYGKWYEGGGDIQDVDNEPHLVPADWHNPVPVPFLVVKEASFLFGIAPRRMPHGEAEKTALETELAGAMQALTDALQYLGAGTKTAAGYGRFEVDEAAKRRRAQIDEQNRMNELAPEKRMREEIVRLTSEQLATMFGKNFNKTKEGKGESWEYFIRVVLEIHGETIRSWATSGEKNRKKTFGKFFPGE